MVAPQQSDAPTRSRVRTPIGDFFRSPFADDVKRPHLGGPLAGIGCAALAYFLFSLQDATIKWLVAGFPVPQLMFMRSAAILPFCIAFGGTRVARRGLASPIRAQLFWRSLILMAAWICYYTAARDLQLAELTTIYFCSPLLVAVLAIPLLNERVTWSRWLSLAIGFAGVVSACRPSAAAPAAGQSMAIMLALLAAGLWAYATVLI